VNEGEPWRIRKKNEVKDTLQYKVKMYKIPPAKWCGHAERIQNWRMSQQIATAMTEETRKRGRPRKRWRYDVEEDLNKMEIKTGRQ